MSDALVRGLHDMADVMDAVERGEFPRLELPQDGFSSSITHDGGAVVVGVHNGRISSLEIDHLWWSDTPEEQLLEGLREALNAAIDGHNRLVFDSLMESGGVPNVMAALWQSQTYLTSGVLMELHDQEGK